MRITLALLAYQQANFIETAARSALAQECEPIEVILSDDCSTDDTYARLKALASNYSGPHRVVVRRNATNVGIGRHINELASLAAGRLVVWMAGDDVSLPQRVARVAQAWDAHDEHPDLVASHVIDMSIDGEDLGVLRVDPLEEWRSIEDWGSKRPYVIGAAHATTRRLFDRFGPLSPDISHEDQINVFRAICSGGALTIDEPLVRYRQGGVSTPRFSPSYFRDFETRRSARHLAVIEQWRRDAETAGCARFAQAAIEWEHEKERFVQRLLTARNLAQQLSAVTQARHVNARYRFNRLLYLRAPRLALALKRAKSR